MEDPNEWNQADTTNSSEEFKKGYRAGYSRGSRTTLSRISRYYKGLSLLVLMLCVGSDVQYELLRSLILFDSSAIPGVRRTTKKINGKTIPCFSPLAKVKQEARENPLSLVHGEKIYEVPSSEFWVTGSQNEDGMVFKGIHVSLKDICTRFLNWTRGDTCIHELAFDVPEIYMLAWSDGARVDRGTVFGRVRFIDTTNSVIHDGSSLMYYWFGYVGKESDIKYMSDIRGGDIEYLEDKIWWRGEHAFQVRFRFLSGDNKMLWSELNLSYPYLCPICVCPKDTEVIDSPWMTYGPQFVRNGFRTLSFQKENVGQFGSSDVPAILASDLAYFDPSLVVSVVPLMHDLKNTLNHGLEIMTQFSRIRVNGAVVERSLGKARNLIEDRIRAILGTKMVWARHLRVTFAHISIIFDGLLDHVPILKKLGEIGKILSYLCYQKKINVDSDVHYARLLVFSNLWIQTLNYWWKEVSHMKKIPCCASTYDHTVLLHLAEQYHFTNILPIHMSEEDGEASIRAKRKVRTNHSEFNVLEKGLAGEQLTEIAQRFLRHSLTNEYRGSMNSTGLKLPTPGIPNVVIWRCTWNINDNDSIRNMLSDLLERYGQGTKLKELRVDGIPEPAECFTVTLNTMPDAPVLHYCKCQQHLIAEESIQVDFGDVFNEMGMIDDFYDFGPEFDVRDDDCQDLFDMD